jgi:hypothetical protein
MSSDNPAPVVLVSTTIMDGTVVRWHRSLTDAETMRPALSASRYGVMTGRDVYLTDVPRAWISAATEAYKKLQANPRADLGHLATHRHSVVANGPLVPVEEADRG